jgi:nucleoid-associated protein YgaU
MIQQAYFENIETKQVVKVQFNPTDLTFAKHAQYAEIAPPGLDSPILQFIRGGNETLSVELFFDTTDLGMGETATSVTKYTDEFYNLVKQNADTHAPPRCRFSWGEPGQPPFSFLCVVESVDRRFVLFSPLGVPLRARLTVKMREYRTVDEMVANLNSADHTKSRTVKRRERLDQISAREYDAAAEWRRIAEYNGLDDPRKIPAGTALAIPPLKQDSVTRENS